MQVIITRHRRRSVHHSLNNSRTVRTPSCAPQRPKFYTVPQNMATQRCTTFELLSKFVSEIAGGSKRSQVRSHSRGLQKVPLNFWGQGFLQASDTNVTNNQLTDNMTTTRLSQCAPVNHKTRAWFIQCLLFLSHVRSGYDIASVGIFYTRVAVTAEPTLALMKLEEINK